MIENLLGVMSTEKDIDVDANVHKTNYTQNKK